MSDQSTLSPTLREVLTEELIARVDIAAHDDGAEAFRLALIAGLSPSWTALEQKVALAEAKVTQLAKDQMMLASAIVTDAEKLSERVWTPPSLAERAREHGRDAAKLREAEAQRDTLREQNEMLIDNITAREPWVAMALAGVNVCVGGGECFWCGANRADGHVPGCLYLEESANKPVADPLIPKE